MCGDDSTPTPHPPTPTLTQRADITPFPRSPTPDCFPLLPTHLRGEIRAAEKVITAAGTGDKSQWEVTAQSWLSPGRAGQGFLQGLPLSKRQRRRRPREVESSPRTHSSAGILLPVWLAPVPRTLLPQGGRSPFGH